MSWLTKLLPSWVPLALAGVLLAALTAGYFVWQSKEREIGRAQVEAADAKALAKQKADDAALSADIIAKQAVALTALQDKANTSVVRYVNAPKTTACGPTMRDASHSVRDLITGSGAAKP
jgi:hypothetical protein